MAHNAAPPPGPATDARGLPARDPTANVIALNKALTKSNRAGFKAIRRELQIITKYNAKLAKAESARIDDIHKADEASRSREAIVNAATVATLAKQVTDSAAALASQVETQRQSTASELKAAMNPVTEKLGVLERALYAGQGGVLATAEARTEQRASAGGRQSNWQLAIGAAGLFLFVLVALVGFLAAHYH